MPDHAHWDGFADFVAFEAAAGGPSPNLNLIGAVADQFEVSRGSKTWLACCYAAAYNTPVSTALWWEWPVGRVLREGPEKLTAWLEENRPGLPVHSNRRRTHGSSKRLALGMHGLAKFAVANEFEEGDDYDRLWSQVQAIPAIGRYFGIKLAGTLHRLGLTDAQQYDIRARGAKNGRRTLALLYPDHRDLLDLKLGKNSQAAVRFSEDAARSVKEWLLEAGLDVDWFQLEALLCEYNQMVKGHRYPGSTSDGDIEALWKFAEHFGREHPVFDTVEKARLAVLPRQIVHTRKSKPMLPIYAEHGYVWSDAVYDRATSTDFARPVVRSTPLTDWKPLTRPEEED